MPTYPQIREIRAVFCRDEKRPLGHLRSEAPPDRAPSEIDINVPRLAPSPSRDHSSGRREEKPKSCAGLTLRLKDGLADIAGSIWTLRKAARSLQPERARWLLREGSRRRMSCQSTTAACGQPMNPSHLSSARETSSKRETPSAHSSPVTVPLLPAFTGVHGSGKTITSIRSPFSIRLSDFSNDQLDSQMIVGMRPASAGSSHRYARTFTATALPQRRRRRRCPRTTPVHAQRQEPCNANGST